MDRAFLPTFLVDYGALLDHFQRELADLSPIDKGRRFAAMVEKVIPLTEAGSLYSLPRARQESHDKGVDFLADLADGDGLLCVQSKYTIKKVDELDSVFSKFCNFERTYGAADENGQLVLGAGNGTAMSFMLITLSDIAGLVARFETSKRPAAQFFRTIKQEGRLHILGGRELLPVLQSAYRRMLQLPNEVQLRFLSGVVHHGDVYVGICSGQEIRRLYANYGDAIFLENIREYLGRAKKPKDGDRATVNQAIANTLSDEPEKMLPRNNGITIRASGLRVKDPDSLLLADASIVNGCQTTMTIVEHETADCAVVVKVVQSNDSWDVAKSANFQNKIDQIDLDIARYVRPQLVRSAATDASVALEPSEDVSVSAVLDAIYEHRVSYDEVRSLFIGLFSRTPNNSIRANYSELDMQLVGSLYGGDDGGQGVFRALFAIQHSARAAASEVQRRVASNSLLDGLFKRFWDEKKPSYRAFLTILALAATVGQHPYRSDSSSRLDRMKSFLTKAEDLVLHRPDEFVSGYLDAFKAVALGIISANVERERSEILQIMYRQMREAKFENLFASAQVSSL